jgi:hypothetical protein
MFVVQILHHVELEPKEHVLTLSVLKLGDNYSQVPARLLFACACARTVLSCVSCVVEAHRASQVNRELRPYVVVGTSYAEGEDAAGRGRISFPTPFSFLFFILIIPFFSISIIILIIFIIICSFIIFIYLKSFMGDGSDP